MSSRSRYTQDDKEYGSGRSRSRSRSPKSNDDRYVRRKEKDYDRKDDNLKKKYEYKNQEDPKRREEDYENYHNTYKREDEAETKKSLEDDSSSGSKKSQQSLGMFSKNKLKSMSIQMKIGSGSVNKPKLTVASAFSQDSDDEPEQLPPEAKMRMKNVGRNTPTSSGPNSFGKTKHGFSDAKKVFERNLKEAMDAARADD